MIELSPGCVHLKDDRKNTPLHWVCSEGHTEIATTLIREHGAKLDVA
jgi:ankyrin repeat protein